VVSSVKRLAIVPKLFLIAYHLRAPYCQQVPPCSRKSQCAKDNSIKFGKTELAQVRHEQNDC